MKVSDLKKYKFLRTMTMMDTPSGKADVYDDPENLRAIHVDLKKPEYRIVQKDKYQNEVSRGEYTPFDPE